MGKTKDPITDYRIDLKRTPAEAIERARAAYERLGDLRLVAVELGVSPRTLDRLLVVFPDLGKAIQGIRDARAAVR